MDIDRAISELGRAQYGIVARRQLHRLQINRHHIAVRIDRGQVEPVTSRVLRIVGAPSSPAQDLMTAVLHAGEGAIVGYGSAAAWWGLPTFRIQPVQIAVPRSRRLDPESFCDIRHATVIPDEHRRTHLGIPIASPALTLFQLAIDLPPEKLAITVDRAWSMRLTSGAELHRLLSGLARRGRNGISNMRRVLDDRGFDYHPPQSNLEQRVLRILSDAQISARPQVDLGDDRWTGRVDFLVEPKIVIEVQSERYHTSLTDRRQDDARHARLSAAGFDVLEVWDREVFEQPWTIIERVRNILWRAVG